MNLSEVPKHFLYLEYFLFLVLGSGTKTMLCQSRICVTSSRISFPLWHLGRLHFLQFARNLFFSSCSKYFQTRSNQYKFFLRIGKFKPSNVFPILFGVGLFFGVISCCEEGEFEKAEFCDELCEKGEFKMHSLSLGIVVVGDSSFSLVISAVWLGHKNNKN